MAIRTVDGATIVTGDDIYKVQRLAIQTDLELEVRTGMRHSRNAAVLGARKLLTDNGRKAPRTKAALLKAFYEWRKEIGDDPTSTKPKEVK